MSYQEIAKNMIDRLPNDKMIFVINILENIGEMVGINLYPEFEPNAETIAAMEATIKIRSSKSIPMPLLAWICRSSTSFLLCVV